MKQLSIFWFRRDLRLTDNHGLYEALASGETILPIFIFDRHILDDIQDKKDLRVQFIHQELMKMNKSLQSLNKRIQTFYGYPEQVFQELSASIDILSVYANEDYEPYGRSRDTTIQHQLSRNKIGLKLFQDHVIFRPGMIHKDDHMPYSIYTPFMRRWRQLFQDLNLQHYKSEALLERFADPIDAPILTLDDMGFQPSEFIYPSKEIPFTTLDTYDTTRDFPDKEKGTSRLGIHLRFGTLSIRSLVQVAVDRNEIYLNELIWREFFIHILWHYPKVVTSSFKSKYDSIPWSQNELEFIAWCNGQTGYPLVDAGMRELNATGHMHNRVRMVVASFLCKHLLIDWRKGEAYFASKLLDYELASNNGNWQWAAGSGCDAAPYFRIFNPTEQLKKFDPQGRYVLKWAPEYGALVLPTPIVDHVMARERALATYKKALNG